MKVVWIWETLWHVQRRYDVVFKHLNDVKSMHVKFNLCNSPKVKSELFTVNNGVRKKWVMSPRPFNVYINKVSENRNGKNWSEIFRRRERINIDGSLYENVLVLYGESEEYLRVMTKKIKLWS